jgi:putative ribosome biogenesis GTPase RsgA
MNKIQKKKQDWKWLFRNFNEANKLVKTIRKRAIIMLGLTRVGKSTLYNSIINP